MLANHHQPQPKSRRKHHRLILIFVILVLAFAPLWILLNNLDFSAPGPLKFGVTFSQEYADEALGLDWTEVYWAVINDLGVKDLRLVAPWDWIESGQGEYNFNDLDWMIKEAAKKNIHVILAIGRRTPRWPECHDPGWLKNLSPLAQNTALLKMVENLVKHFKKYDNIVAWQVENEPFLSTFGECPKSDAALLQHEISLVRSLDERPIITTHSGELGAWDNPASLADIFGTTMYRAVWTPLIGDWRYPLPAVFYYLKARALQNKYRLIKVIVSELQMESWVPQGEKVTAMSLRQQFNSFGLDDFQKNLAYVKRAGFTEVYLWGVEWWYWLKTVQNHPEFWQAAQAIWQK